MITLLFFFLKYTSVVIFQLWSEKFQQTVNPLSLARKSFSKLHEVQKAKTNAIHLGPDTHN